MTDKTDTGESAVGQVVAGKGAGAAHDGLGGIRAAIDGIGTSGAVEVVTGIRAAVEESAIHVDRFSADIEEAVSELGKSKAPWTYADYIPADAVEIAEVPFVSRDEFLAMLREYGHGISERTLRSWESTELLPKPIRRWQEPGSRSGARTLYPWWASFAVSLVQRLKALGYGPREIRREVERVLPELVDGYYQGTRVVSISHQLGRELVDVLERMPWPKGKAPAMVEIRVWDQDGEMLHDQKMTVPDGKTITDGH